MERSKCLSRLQKLCSKAEYCSADIYNKALKDLEGDAEAAAEIVASLLEDRYVDDARYAAAFAREKSSIQGWGPIKIRYQLRMKRIPEPVITAALEELDSAMADARLVKLLQTKARTLEGDPQIKLKLLKFGLSRGYDYSVVNDALLKL